MIELGSLELGSAWSKAFISALKTTQPPNTVAKRTTIFASFIIEH